VRPFKVALVGFGQGWVASLTASSLCFSQLQLAMTCLALHALWIEAEGRGNKFI